MTKLNDQWVLKQRVIELANREATIWGVSALAVVAAATALATKRYENFRKYTSWSAKVSLAPMTGLAVYFFKYEATAYYAQANPEKYGLAPPDESPNRPKPIHLPYYQRLLNATYDNPYIAVAVCGVPLATGVLYQQLQKRDLTLSQRIMHSRVYAQFGVLAVFVASMGLTEYMRRRGKFGEETTEHVTGKRTVSSGGLIPGQGGEEDKELIEARQYHDESV